MVYLNKNKAKRGHFDCVQQRTVSELVENHTALKRATTETGDVLQINTNEKRKRQKR